GLYDSDGGGFNHYNGELALHGRNPYTSDALFWDAIRRFPNAGATPLHLGRYAQSTYGPSLDQVVRDVHSELAEPSTRGSEFAPASLHSYPALAFLVYVPAIWLGLPTTLAISLLCIVVFLLAAGWGAPQGTRLLVGGILLANTLLVVWTLRGSFDAIALLPALLAWRTLGRRWLSPGLLGLACAIKQLVWPLALLYATVVWRRDGLREAIRRLALTVLTFLLPNLPFLLAAPGQWASSLLLPITLPIFPSGSGLVGLARAGLVPLLPPGTYAPLELVGLCALVLWFGRAATPPRPAIALVVGLLPFVLAWHSLFAYLLAIPSLAVYAALEPLRQDVEARRGNGLQVKQSGYTSTA